jgi:hypothetical protein
METMKLSNVNARVNSAARMAGKLFAFDGTTVGLVNAARSRGGTVGSIVDADFGGNGSDMVRYAIVDAKGDGRTGRLWIKRK